MQTRKETIQARTKVKTAKATAIAKAMHEEAR